MKRDVYAPEDKDWKLQKDEDDQIVITTDDDLSKAEELRAVMEASDKMEELENEHFHENQINNDRTDPNSSGSHYR